MIESYYTSSEACRMWQGLQTITDYKGKHRQELPSDTSIPDELNYFHAPFKEYNTERCMRAPAVITLSAADVSKTFKQVNIHKSQTDYQDVYCKYVLANWQVSSLTFSTSPCPSL